MTRVLSETNDSMVETAIASRPGLIVMNSGPSPNHATAPVRDLNRQDVLSRERRGGSLASGANSGHKDEYFLRYAETSLLLRHLRRRGVRLLHVIARFRALARQVPVSTAILVPPRMSRPRPRPQE
jgi:hypothetical protein